MRILLTNDDGIHAEGLAALERIARTLSDDVWVVAPEPDQSGFAHSLSLSEPLRLRKIGEKHYRRARHADRLRHHGRASKIMPELPDLILSGVNSGSNIADDVTYSGTVAGAMEGTLLGIRSIALSQAYIVRDDERVVPWETAEALAPALLDRLLGTRSAARRLPQRQFPELPARGSRGHAIVTTQGKLTYGLWVEERADGRGFPYYWLRFGREHDGPARQAPTCGAAQTAMSSVTPLKLDLTAHEIMDQLTKALA